ncbi:MAG: T9SS type A sorting domain-containing protein [Oceanihabitans sp.]
MWTYTDDPTSDFVTGTQAFSGSATWTVDPAEYTAMLAAPASGNIYFTADDVTDLPGATLLGTYSVSILPLSVTDVQYNDFTYYPNPVKEVWNIASQKVIEQVEVYNILGQTVSIQKLNSLNGAINTSSLVNGTYFFRVTLQEGATKTIKVIKK